jgi:hypothetical protein
VNDLGNTRVLSGLSGLADGGMDGKGENAKECRRSKAI